MRCSRCAPRLAAAIAVHGILLAPPALGAVAISPAEGRFEFRDALGNADRPITVYTYRPQRFTADAPILFAMHGLSRNAEGARRAWIGVAQRTGILVVAPRFSNEHYPGSAMYNRGNVVAGSRPVPEAKWTYTAIEHLFDAVRAATGSRRTRYLIFGHSAGGQFVHRLVLFKPEARIELAIAANAGWYAMPTFREAFPAGIKGSVVTEASLRRALQAPLVILLGEQDNDPNAANLRKSSAAERQGPHRLARGKAFFATAQAEAKRAGVRLAWRLKTVPGVGHSSSRMATAATGLADYFRLRESSASPPSVSRASVAGSGTLWKTETSLDRFGGFGG